MIFRDNGKYYEHGTMSMKIGGESWVLVNTFAYSKPTDKHFMVIIDEALNPYILFGDGKYGQKPAANAKISEVKFYLTTGIRQKNTRREPWNLQNSLSTGSMKRVRPFLSADP